MGTSCDSLRNIANIDLYLCIFPSGAYNGLSLGEKFIVDHFLEDECKSFFVTYGACVCICVCACMSEQERENIMKHRFSFCVCTFVCIAPVRACMLFGAGC